MYEAGEKAGTKSDQIDTMFCNLIFSLHSEGFCLCRACFAKN